VPTIADLRAWALGWSLRPHATVRAALAELEFVQMDPIRAPARAQDLILRQRVDDYRAGDLDRAYPDLDAEEDVLYAYGVIARRLRRLLYPRLSRTGPYTARGLDAKVLAFVRANGVTHPRDLQAQFGRNRVTNDWGGRSAATTRILESLRYYGLLRVARREAGVRLYEPAPPMPPALPDAERLRELVLVITRILAPAPLASLRMPVNMLGYGARGVSGRRTILRDLVADGSLVAADVDGVTYVWPVDLEPADRVEARVRFLAPFDPVVWDRERFELFWGWPYRFEAYVPPAKRQLGYYALPLLWRDRVVGWANATKDGAGLAVDVGYVDRRPRERGYAAALANEIAALQTFLQPPPAGGHQTS
jgi:uncharacterized protein YcaQ